MYFGNAEINIYIGITFKGQKKKFYTPALCYRWVVLFVAAEENVSKLEGGKRVGGEGDLEL